MSVDKFVHSQNEIDDRGLGTEHPGTTHRMDAFFIMRTIQYVNESVELKSRGHKQKTSLI